MSKSSAYVKAMSLLAIGDMSERRLREKLSAKGFSEDEIRETADELRQKGYISDPRLIENLIAYYSKRKYFGKYRIRLELLSKFDRESVEDCFDTLCECMDFKEIAAEFAKKDAEKGTPRDKLTRKLQRLGHDSASIRYAISKLSNIE